MKHFAYIFTLILAIFSVTACSNYRLAGTAVDLPFKSIYVEPVRNTSYIPQATQLLTNEITNAINQVPTLHTEYKNDAQAKLSVTIIEYDRVAASSLKEDTALAGSYRMEVVAQCTLTTANGEVIFKNRKVKASVMLYSNTYNDVIGNEYQNMPVLMRELGSRIKDAIIGIW